MTRTVSFDCPYCPGIRHVGETVVDHKCECSCTGKTVYFDARYCPVDPDEPAHELNAILDDIIKEDRAWRELRATLVGFTAGVMVSAVGSLIAWLFLLG